MRTTALLIILAICSSVSAQTTIQTDMGPCGVHGKARKQSKEYDLNTYKNRYQLPSDSDVDSTITLDQLLHSADPNGFSHDTAVILTGYVFNVKVGGIESCNCKSKNQKYRDTHIELTPDADHTDSSYRVIVEVTPRLRSIMLKKGTDWSTAHLKKMLIGKQVQVKGWLLYDLEHEDQASANDPNDQIGRKNFRGTCWEIHPVTALKVIQP